MIQLTPASIKTLNILTLECTLQVLEGKRLLDTQYPHAIHPFFFSQSILSHLAYLLYFTMSLQEQQMTEGTSATMNTHHKAM